MTIDATPVVNSRWITMVDAKSIQAQWKEKTSSEVVRVLDGKNMDDYNPLFAAFAQKFAFPSYFGHNWPALSDCLEDLSGIDDFISMDIVITNWSHVLKKSPEDIPVLLRILNNAADDWTGTKSPIQGAGNVRFNVYLVP